MSDLVVEVEGLDPPVSMGDKSESSSCFVLSPKIGLKDNEKSKEKLFGSVLQMDSSTSHGLRIGDNVIFGVRRVNTIEGLIVEYESEVEALRCKTVKAMSALGCYTKDLVFRD